MGEARAGGGAARLGGVDYKAKRVEGKKEGKLDLLNVLALGV